MTKNQLQEKKQWLQATYGFAFPESFFQFYEFTQKVPKSTFKGFDGVMEMSLGGVFQIFEKDDLTDFNPILESRYYNDPPEFFYILRGHTDGLHWGYYLDDVNRLENICVVSYWHSDAFQLNVAGHTIFEAFRRELEMHHTGVLQNMEDDPHSLPVYQKELILLEQLRIVLMAYETGDRPEKGWDYVDKYDPKRNTIADTRDCMGIVVPPELYRPLAGEDKFQIWNYEPTPKDVKMLYENAMAALKEGYPGTALKAGKDLWVYDEYFKITYRLLDAAYEALGQQALRNALKQAKAFRKRCDDFREGQTK